jgi:large repetitive protein
VTDETGNVEGATVNLCAIDTTTPVLYTATTIANGTYAIASVAVGTYDVWFSKANHVTAVTDDQAVVANTDKVVNKVLLEYGTLTGAITAPPDPEGALVELYTVYPGTPAYSGAAGALPGGTYTIANIAPGTYQIKASLDGYTDKFIMDYVVAGDDDLTLNIDLTAV